MPTIHDNITKQHEQLKDALLALKPCGYKSYMSDTDLLTLKN